MVEGYTVVCYNCQQSSSFKFPIRKEQCPYCLALISSDAGWASEGWRVDHYGPLLNIYHNLRTGGLAYSRGEE